MNIYRLIEKEKDNEEQVLKRNHTRSFKEEGEDVGEEEEGGDGPFSCNNRLFRENNRLFLCDSNLEFS